MRELTPETVTALNGWARDHAAMFVQNRKDGQDVERCVDHGGGNYTAVTLKRFSRDWIMLQFHNFTYKDEFEHIVAAFRRLLGPDDLADFETRLAQFPSRSDEAFRQLLEEKRPAGYQPQEA